MNSPTIATAAPVSDLVLDAVLQFAAAIDMYNASAGGAWHALMSPKDHLRQVAIEHVEPKRDVEPDLFADVRRWLEADDEQTTCFVLLDVAENRGLPTGDIRRLCDAIEADLRDVEAGFLRRLWARSLN